MYLSEGDEEIDLLRTYIRTGRPLGKDDFVDRLEKVTGRVLRKKRQGPKKSDN